MVRHKKLITLAFILFTMVLLCACERISSHNKIYMKDAEGFEEEKEEAEGKNAFERGYNLPIGQNMEKEAKEKCKNVMGLIREIYLKADKGDSSNVVITEETIYQMLLTLQGRGYSAFYRGNSLNMVNYQKMEKFLEDSIDGKEGGIDIYNVHSSGGVGRKQFMFDGTDMYELCTIAIWNNKNEPCIINNSYSRIKEWKYTEKGWFIFEYCVPEPPEVSEIVNGNAMIRIKPLREEYREMAKNYLLPIGYQGNNLLCSDWNAEQMDDIDYNGLFEYLYTLKNKGEGASETYVRGVPKEEFEQLIMEYLPITAGQLEQYAIYDKESQTYAWERLGCMNYSPTFFGTSIPEITNIIDNRDGNYTLMVDAVCEMLGSDTVITHKLTIQIVENDNIKYLGNEVLGNGIEKIPEYQHRIKVFFFDILVEG